MPSSSALIVFAKEPSPGDVKTRLTEGGAVSEEEACRLYEAFLSDALQQYTDFAASYGDLKVRLYWSGDLDAALDRALDGVTVHEQRGADLGERMATAFRETLRGAADRAVVIGTDHPSLPSSRLSEAFDSLNEPGRLVIGPSTDGGYYLLGMHGYVPEVFDDMTYSHPHVFHNTLRRAAQTEGEVVVLPEWYDVDTPAALRRLLYDLDGRGASDDAPPPDASRTREVVSDLNLRNRLRPEDK
jgi:hypothetical protein